MLRRFLAILPPNVRIRLRGVYERVISARRARRTYAQFGEDAVLLALLAELKHHGEPITEPGFYVDVGAYLPVTYSNTYALYKRGWRGITIEASPGSEPLFRITRPRDIHVNVAIGDSEGQITYFTWGTPTVVNTADPEHAALFTRELGRPPETIQVPLRTLSSVLTQYVPPGISVDVMSIDVEGMSLACLRGNDWTTFKPRVILVEVDVNPLHHGALDPSIAYLQSRGYALRAIAGPTAILVLNEKKTAE